MKWLRQLPGWVKSLAGWISAVTTLAAAAVFLWTKWEDIQDRDVPLWALVVVVLAMLVLAVGSFFLGRRSYRRLPSSSVERAREELQVARTYLRHTIDFMEGLRLSVVEATPANTVRRLEALRDLVFDAIIQGINTGAGEHIRCALFVPVDEVGTQVLRVRRHRGHTHRVDLLRLPMTSVAGRAFLEQRAIYVPDAETSPLVATTTAGRPVKTLLCLPSYSFRAQATGAPIGVFSVASNYPDAFTLSDQAFISACADIIALIEFFVDVFQQMATAQATARAARAQPGSADPAHAAAELPPTDENAG